jgi:hypothetical protein
MKLKGSYDFYLVVATVLVLFAISLISIYGMFYFKYAQIQEMAPALKFTYMDRMNSVVAPFIIILILLLGICVPKRLLPTAWLNRIAVLLVGITIMTALLAGIKTSLLVILVVSLSLQSAVLVLALFNSRNLNFHKKGYWVRLGSSLVHLGFILLVLDLLLYRYQTLHLFLFWVTTGASVSGMFCCFYAELIVGLLTGKRNP